MNKCLKIMLNVSLKEGFMQNIVQKFARKFELEGFVQVWAQDQVKIIVCGEKGQVDSFVDLLHKESHKAHIENIEIEPFLKDKDYRGVFRVIE